MRNRVQYLEPALGKLRVQELCQPSPESRVLMNDDGGLRDLASVVVDGDEIVERRLGNDAETGTEAERVLQPAGDYAVDHAHVHEIRKVVTRRRLACRQADRACVASD